MKTQTEYLSDYAALRGWTYEEMLRTLQAVPLPVFKSLLTDFYLWLPREAATVKQQLLHKMAAL
jgi:hypothetical protein